MSTEALSDRQLETIGSYVKNNLPEWLNGAQPDISAQFFEYMGRLIRLEEAINRQGDLIEKLIHQMDKRIDQMDKRFDQIDKRIDQIDKRIDQIDKRIDQVDKRINELSHQMDKRFEQVDRRFEQMEKYIEKIDKRITLMFVVLTAISSLVGAAVVVAQFIA